MDPIEITPPRWEGELKWEDLDLIVRGELLPSPAYIRRMAYELALPMTSYKNVREGEK